jgi:hypothetical protein
MLDLTKLNEMIGSFELELVTLSNQMKNLAPTPENKAQHKSMMKKLDMINGCLNVLNKYRNNVFSDA